MIIGKKQIILSALVLALSLAVYLNWQFSRDDSGMNLTNKLDGGSYKESSTMVDGEAVDDENYGEAYFAEAKVTRTRSRDEAIETLKGMLKDSELSADQKAELALEAAKMAKSIEAEGKIENLIKAKGFDECMVYYDTTKVDVVVKTAGLDDPTVAAMKDIIIRETNVADQNISIVEVN